jgi:hypothetical protein
MRIYSGGTVIDQLTAVDNVIALAVIGKGSIVYTLTAVFVAWIARVTFTDFAYLLK